jgi:hypothetical protein
LLKAPEDFFHFKGERRNFIKLLVATTSVGAGLSYALAAGGRNGLLMLAGPIALCVGFYLLSLFNRFVVHPRVTRHPNLLLGFEREIAHDREARSAFGPIVALPLVAAFLLIFAFELFVSAQVLAAFIMPDRGAGAEIVISTILFAASLGYCLVGGAQAIARNEHAQLAGILVLLATLVVAAFLGGGATDQTPEPRQLLKTDGHVLAAIGLAIVSAISTQFYSLLNMHAMSNLDDDAEKVSMLRKVGIGAALLFVVMVTLGAAVPMDWSGGLGTALGGLLKPFHAIPVLAPVAAAIIVFGLTSLLISTIDALMITLTMFVTENLIRRRAPQGEVNGGMPFGGPRVTLALLFGVGYLVLSLFNYLRPDIFYLLLSIGSGIDVFSPLIVLAGILSRYPSGLAVLTDRAMVVYAALFVLAVGSNIYLTSVAPQIVPFVGLTYFGASALFSAVLYLRSGGVRERPLLRHAT